MSRDVPIGSAVMTFIGYKQTDWQAKFILEERMYPLIIRQIDDAGKRFKTANSLELIKEMYDLI